MRWPWARALVTGSSMLPTYRPGDVLLWRRVGRRSRLRAGDVVVVDLPEGRPLAVKRLGELTGDGWWLLSDSGAGTGSETYGAVPHSAVRGRVLCRLYRLPGSRS